MSKFIEIHENIINVKDVKRVEFFNDDIYTGLFPKGDNGKFLVDCIPFEFARVYTSDREFPLVLDLYVPTENENEEEWFKKNVAYISMMMAELTEVLKPVKVTGREYM